MRDKHGSPFEHSVFQWYVKAPIFVAREWFRHRAAAYNEFSGRYARFQAEFYIPDHARVVDPDNKQSTIRTDDEDLERLVDEVISHCSAKAYERYEELLAAGIGREMARLVLPVNLYTQFWWTVNARNVMNFVSLRNAPEAQFEIQEFARAIEADFERLMPWTYEAFIEGGRAAP
jgi:thymidylate synthase (FAD)